MDHENPLLVIASIVGLATAVFIHLLLTRMTDGKRAYGCVLRGVVCGAFTTGLISIIALWPPTVSSTIFVDEAPAIKLTSRSFVLTDSFLLFFNLVIFAGLGFCYINFVGLSIASLRIRMLQELLAHPEGMRLEDILANYNPRVLIDNRIDRLTTGGQLVEKDGRFHTGRRGVLWAARIMNFMKFIILGNR